VRHWEGGLKPVLDVDSKAKSAGSQWALSESGGYKARHAAPSPISAASGAMPKL